MITRRSWPWNSSTDPTVMSSHFSFLNNFLIFSTLNWRKVTLNYHIISRDRTGMSLSTSHKKIPTREERFSKQEYIYFQNAFDAISFSVLLLSEHLPVLHFFHWRIKENLSYLWFFFSPLTQQPNVGRAASFLRFVDHTQWYTTSSRTPLDRGLVHCRNLYLTTHNTRNRLTSVLPAGSESAITASGCRPSP